jgi:hypothetical protein
MLRLSLSHSQSGQASGAALLSEHPRCLFVAFQLPLEPCDTRYGKGRRRVVAYTSQGSAPRVDCAWIPRGPSSARTSAEKPPKRVFRHLASGALVRVLEDWCPPFPGFFLYYPSRRQRRASLAALIDTLRL